MRQKRGSASLKVMRLGLAAALTLALISLLLPWLAQSGWAGEAVRISHQEERDASAIFYTDSERLLEIVERAPLRRLPQRKD